MTQRLPVAAGGTSPYDGQKVSRETENASRSVAVQGFAVARSPMWEQMAWRCKGYTIAMHCRAVRWATLKRRTKNAQRH
jgi:hypothetical protein